ncbi:MAG: NTPase, partial [Boseongicola sp. SB0662_bin_57]|nr:NTPase [Boseongicola sp. SB0662_bin_57]
TPPKMAESELDPKHGCLVGSLIGAFAGTAAGRFAESALNAIGRFLPTEDCDEALQGVVAKALAESDRRFLVVIDDIDRLAPDEALTIFRLVKSIGRLPNVIYLLAYDRRATERAVKERYPSEGAHYLEKIVQAAFELPNPGVSALTDMFNGRLGNIFGNADPNDQEHLQHLLEKLVMPELRTPRDVIRLSHGLSVTYPAVRGEVDIADFIALETLRLFRPSVYLAIRSQRLLLVSLDPDEPRGDDAERAQRYEKLFLPDQREETRSRLKTGILELFPRLASAWGPVTASDGTTWDRHRRVCSEPHFDTYFRFALSSHTVPMSEVAELIQCADDPDMVTQAFRAALRVPLAKGRTKASVLLDELKAHAAEFDMYKVTSFLQALFSIADELRVESDESRGFVWVDNPARMHRLTRALLMHRTSLQERSRILFEAIQNSSLGWFVEIAWHAYAQHYARSDNEAPARPEECLLERDHADQLRQIALQRLDEAAADGDILKAPNLLSVLFRWHDFVDGSSPAPQAFCDSVLGDDHSTILLARAVLGKSYVSTGNYGEPQRRDRAQLGGLESLLDVDGFKARLVKLVRSPDLDPDDKDVLQRLLAVWDE